MKLIRLTTLLITLLLIPLVSEAASLFEYCMNTSVKESLVCHTEGLEVTDNFLLIGFNADEKSHIQLKVKELNTMLKDLNKVVASAVTYKSFALVVLMYTRLINKERDLVFVSPNLILLIESEELIKEFDIIIIQQHIKYLKQVLKEITPKGVKC